MVSQGVALGANAASLGGRPPGGLAREWRSLRYFNYYRIILAGLLLALAWSDLAPRVGLYASPAAFSAVSLVYLLFGVACGFWVAWERPSLETQVVIQVFVDVLVVTVLMHASGGISSGLGVLLIVTVAGGSILARRRVAVLFAAVATVVLLGEQIVAARMYPLMAVNYAHAGILGAVFFAAALLANLSASRIRLSEALVAERDVDLRNLAELNEYIIRRMQSGILVVDALGRIVLSNESSRALLGLEGAVDDRPLGEVAPALHERYQRWCEDRERSSYGFTSPSAQLELTASFAALGPLGASGVLVFLEDASAMTQRAQQLKLASLGRLTASIAHEIRNPLGAISHAGQLLGESERLEAGDRRLSQIIQDNCRRVNGIIENVLELSRRRPAVRRNLELQGWLEDFVSEHAASEKARSGALTFAVAPADLTVPFDPDQLHQVVTNLAENGLRHSPARPVVQLNAGMSTETQRPYLDIVDEGEGIRDEDRDHVFEPFFTTRSDGTGLGLYVARELCEANQASLRLLPSVRGCHFRITFADPRRRG